jgi:hypothetical protein
MNPGTSELEKTFLSEDHAAGRTTLSVKNNDRFAADLAILVGEDGGERTETLITDGILGKGTINLFDPTEFAHNADDAVYVLRWNQMKFYRANSIDGSYTLIATENIDFDNNDHVTYYDDVTGTSANYYKVKFFNSASGEESDFSDPMSATGYPAGSIGAAIDVHVRRIRDTQFSMFTPEEYMDMANEVNDELTTQSHRPYDFLKKSVTVDTQAGVNYIDLDQVCLDANDEPDFWKFNFLAYNRTLGGVTRTYQIEEPLTYEAFVRKYRGGNWQNSDDLLDVALDEDSNRLYLGPAPRTNVTGSIEIHYWRHFPQFDSLADRVLTPTSLIYRMKFRAEYYHAKAETDGKFASLAQQWEGKYGNEAVKMQRANRKDAGTPMSFTPRRSPLFRKRFHL